MAQTLQTRPATSTDQDFLFETRRTTLKTYVTQTTTWNDTEQRRTADKEFTELPYKIIEENNHPVGYVCVIHHPDHDFIEEIALQPEAQARGIGTRLLQDILRTAQQRDVPVRLSVFTSNPARTLYTRLGFVVTRIDEPRAAMEWREPLI